jgi:hypothetical protein
VYLEIVIMPEAEAVRSGHVNRLSLLLPLFSCRIGQGANRAGAEP